MQFSLLDILQERARRRPNNALICYCPSFNLTMVSAFISHCNPSQKCPIDIVVSSAVQVLKSLVQSQRLPTANASGSSLAIISRLAYRIDEIHHPDARACVVWLVGQYSADEARSGDGVIEGVVEWAPDVLRRTAKTFRQEVSSFSALFRLSRVDMKILLDFAGQTPSRYIGGQTPLSLTDR